MTDTPTLVDHTEFASALPSDPLWPRIAAFCFDTPGAAMPFTARLARDQGWSHAYARRVVGEYRRFVFLCLRAGHPCTPSVDVDEAWHLHLLYTESYWDDFCGDTLGRPLHHGPTRGGRAEAAKHTDWYARTLAAYETAFGAEPPADIWPSPGERMAAANRPRVVRSATHWVVRKPGALRTLYARLRAPRAWTLALCVAALLATILGARAATARAQAPGAPHQLAIAGGDGGGGVVLAVAGGAVSLVGMAAVLSFIARAPGDEADENRRRDAFRDHGGGGSGSVIDAITGGDGGGGGGGGCGSGCGSGCGGCGG